MGQGYISFRGVSASQKLILIDAIKMKILVLSITAQTRIPEDLCILRTIQSAGISPSFVASSAAGKDGNQPVVTQHEMHIRRKAVILLQGAHWNNLELLWIVTIQIRLS